MRTTLTAVSALALLASIAPAAAADVYSSAKDPIAYTNSGPVNWTGFYLGVNGGYAEGVSSRDSTGTASITDGVDVISATAPIAGADPTGFLFGGQAGYLYQSGGFVFGGEFSFDGSNVTGDKAGTPMVAVSFDGAPVGTFGPINTTMHQQLDYVGTLTGVAGVTLGNAMLYAKGGLAFGQVQESITANAGGGMGLVVSRTGIDTGWTAGAGVAYKFTPNWSIALEWDYYDLGSHSMAGDLPIGGGEAPLNLHLASSSIPEDFWAAKAALNYQVGSVYQSLK